MDGGNMDNVSPTPSKRNAADDDPDDQASASDAKRARSGPLDAFLARGRNAASNASSTPSTPPGVISVHSSGAPTPLSASGLAATPSLAARLSSGLHAVASASDPASQAPSVIASPSGSAADPSYTPGRDAHMLSPSPDQASGSAPPLDDDAEIEADDIAFLNAAYDETMNAWGGDTRNPGPSTLRATLLNHQQIGLAWLISRESKKPRGGILADDMGLGKTVQMIALCLSNLPLEEVPGERERLRTLVVVPASLMQQWRDEIAAMSKIALKVEVHHGVQKSNDPNWLCTCDFVITTYGTLAKEAPLDDGFNNRVRDAGPLFRIKWFRVILDEASAIKNRSSDNAKAVAKLKSKRRWCLTGTPIQNSLDDLIALFVFVKYSPYDDPKVFHKTFCQSNHRRGRRGPVFKLTSDGKKRLQVCLGAICLRRRKESQLDGKPIIDLPEPEIEVASDTFSREEQEYYSALESQSQLKFSRFVKAGTVVKNYANTLMLLLRLRQACNHPLLCMDKESQKLAMQGRDAAIIASYAEEDPGDDADADADDDVELLDFSEARAKAKAKAAEPVLDVDRMLVVDLKRELRKRGLHPHGLKKALQKRLRDFLATEPPAAGGDIKALLKFAPHVRDRITAGDVNAECPICLDVIIRSQSIVTLCGHAFCRACIDKYTQSGATECPSCRLNIRPADYTPASDVLPDPAIDDDDDDDDDKASAADPPGEKVVPFAQLTYRNKLKRLSKTMDASKAYFAGTPSSTKISKLLRGLHVDRDEDDQIKSLVFSQWTSMLDLIEPMLQQEGFQYVRYDGTLDQARREHVVATFKEDPRCTVMLCSLKSCAYGLNLTCATRVYMLDPWWNPSVEEQAIGRAHRIGQWSTVRVQRMAIAGTVEERILELQEKKRSLAQSALGEESKGDLQQNLGRLGLDDLRALFNVDATGNAL